MLMRFRSQLRKIEKRFQLPPAPFERLLHMLEPMVASTFEFLKECHTDIPSVDVNLALSFCKLFESLLASISLLGKFQQNASILQDIFDGFMCFAYVWSMGSNLVSQSRLKFDYFSRNLLANYVTFFPEALTIYVRTSTI